MIKVIDSGTFNVYPREPILHARLVHLTLPPRFKTRHLRSRAVHPLSHRFDTNARHFNRFLLDIGKFYRADIREGVRTRQNAYDISGEPFTSLDDPADPRVAKVKRVLRRHLRRVPTDKDIDTFVYMYFGSDSFTDRRDPLWYGIQNSHYTADGRHTHRDEYNSYGNPNPIRRRMRRMQRRVRRLRGPRGERRYEYGSNSENRSNYNSSNDNRNNSNNSNTSASRSAQYMQNKSRVNANKAKNKSYKNWIKWEEQIVNNLPSDPITLNTFSNGQKAVKIHPTANHYVSPQTFRSMARTSMTDAFNKNGNAVLFQNPLTRQKVRRSNIKFVIDALARRTKTLDERPRRRRTPQQQPHRPTRARTPIDASIDAACAQKRCQATGSIGIRSIQPGQAAAREAETEKGFKRNSI